MSMSAEEATATQLALNLINQVCDLLAPHDLNLKVTVLCGVAGVVVADHSDVRSPQARDALIAVIHKHVRHCAVTVTANRGALDAIIVAKGRSDR